MSVDQLKADLAALRQDVDSYYSHLVEPLTQLYELSDRWSDLVRGSSRDLTQVANAFGKVRSGFYVVEDALIDLSNGIDTYATGF